MLDQNLIITPYAGACSFFTCTKNLMAVFMKALNSCGLDIDHKKRKTIPTWNSSRKYKVLKSFNVCLVSTILDTV